LYVLGRSRSFFGFALFRTTTFFWPVGAISARRAVTSMRGWDVEHLSFFIAIGHNRFQSSGTGFALRDDMMLNRVRFGNGFQTMFGLPFLAA